MVNQSIFGLVGCGMKCTVIGAAICIPIFTT